MIFYFDIVYFFFNEFNLQKNGKFKFILDFICRVKKMNVSVKLTADQAQVIVHQGTDRELKMKNDC